MNRIYKSPKLRLTTRLLAGFIIFLIIFLINDQVWSQQVQQPQQFQKSQSPAQPTASPTSTWHNIAKNLKDNAFGYSILFLILTTVVSSIIAAIFKDRCLKDFNRYPAVVDLRDNFRFGGKLRVENTGLELLFDEACSDNDAPEASYILYKPEYNKLHALVRYHDMLSEAEKKKREREIERVYHPHLIRRTKRKVRNLMISVKDALIEGFSLTLNQFKRTMGQSQMMENQSQYIDRMGKTVITQGTATAYDPLIDKLIGLKVAVEATTDSGNIEYVGILKEYSADFIELLDVELKSGWQLVLDLPNKPRGFRGIQAQISENNILLVSDNVYNVLLRSAEYQVDSDSDAGESEELNSLIPSHGKISFKLSAKNAKSAILHFESCRTADLILPRSYSIVRHRLETYTPNILNEINPFDDIKEALTNLKEKERQFFQDE